MTASSREVPAPGLTEVAAAWWDLDVEPVVAWSADARHFWLGAPGRTERLTIARLARSAVDPGRIARAMADGLAGCDFPPVADRADRTAVRATLASRLGADAPALDDEP